MENPTAFDLNRQILAWRENLGQSPAISGEQLDELEEHLRDSVATLQTQGLTASEAFLVAVLRVGGSGTLVAEFGKVNRSEVWLDRLFWMVVGLQLWNVVYSLMALLVQTISMVALTHWSGSQTWHPLTNLSLAQFLGLGMPLMVLSLAHLFVLAGSLAFSWWLVGRRGDWLSGYFRRLLLRRSIFAVIMMVLVVWLIGSFSASLPVELMYKYGNSKAALAVMQSQNFSQFFLSPLQPACLVIITIFLARRRHKASPTVCSAGATAK